MSDVLSEIDERQVERFDGKVAHLLTQKDKFELIERTDQVKIELMERIDQVKFELMERIDQVRSELIERNQKIENSLLKTIYVVGLVQFLAIVGSVLAIMNFMR